MCSVSYKWKSERHKKKAVKCFIDSIQPFYYTAKFLGFSAYFIGNRIQTKRQHRIRYAVIDGSMVFLNIVLNVFSIIFTYTHLKDIPKNGFVIVDVGTNIAFFVHIVWTLFSMVLLFVLREPIHMAVYKFGCMDMKVIMHFVCRRGQNMIYCRL